MKRMNWCMSPKEVQEQLSVREWIGICSWIDTEFGGKVPAHTLQGSGWNDNQMPVAALSKTVQFRVLKIIRTKRQLVILFDLGHGVLRRLDFAAFMDKKGKAA